MAQSLIRFHSTNKINNYDRGGNKREKKRKKKRQKIQNILHNNQNVILLNIFPESLLSGSFPLLRVTVTSPP